MQGNIQQTRKLNYDSISKEIEEHLREENFDEDIEMGDFTYEEACDKIDSKFVNIIKKVVKRVISIVKRRVGFFSDQTIENERK